MTRLEWFFAFSTYENGAWTDSCVPSYTVKAAQFCGPGGNGRETAGGSAFESLAAASEK